MTCQREDLVHESSITWLYPGITPDMPYVRERVWLTRGRQGEPKADEVTNEGIVLGYANLDATAIGHNGYYRRRVLWLEPHDRYFDPGGVYRRNFPMEAVLPSTVHPKTPGVQDERCRGAWPIPGQAGEMKASAAG